VFLDMGPSILFLVFPCFFRCFSLFMIGRVSSSRLSLLSPQDLTSNDLTLKQVCISINASCNEILHLLS